MKRQRRSFNQKPKTSPIIMGIVAVLMVVGLNHASAGEQQTDIQSGKLRRGTAQHFAYDVASGTGFAAYLGISSGQARLYVKWGAAPSINDYDCTRNVSAGEEWGCNLTVPTGITTAHVMIYGVNKGNSRYTLTVHYFAPGGGCSDADDDGVCDADDVCPGADDYLDTDGDGAPDCMEQCPGDPGKTLPGVCGCGVADVDADGDSYYACLNDACDYDPNKTTPGICGCGNSDADSDGDGTADCHDACPNDNPNDPDGNGICGDQSSPSPSDCTGPGVAEDAANSLCWMYETAPSALNFADATNYCATLVLDGYDDWRLPTIDELRMIVEGCPSQEYGGACGVTDPTCLHSSCDNSCGACASGNYLAPSLTGVVDWATISSSDDGSGLFWTVRYVNAYIYRRGSASTNAVRCVRNTVACSDSDGDGVCDADDICPGFDDTLDADGDGTPDGCDICPLDNPDDPDGNGICGDQVVLPSCVDLAGTNWGSCAPSPLGAAVINGNCSMIFGCEVPTGIALWANLPECEQNCEGCTDNSQCAVTEYCEFAPVTQCGTMGFGSCVLRAEVCAQIWDPVCSCTERTHSSYCHASAAGETVDYPGPCICTSDPDGDDICDPHDTCPNDPDNDADYDGICGDVDPCPNDPNNDEDGDGMCGDVDPCPTDPNPGCQPDPCAGIGDVDGDSVCDDVDNCVNYPNPGQEDTDGNGIGDACETCTGGTPTLHSYDVGGPNTFGEPAEFTELDGLLYFRARVEGYGEELMAYDPVADDTFLVADIMPGADGGSPYYLTAHAGKLYFRAKDASYDEELHVYDPAVDQVDKIDVDPAFSSNPKDLFSASDGLLYFNAREDNDIELYTYNPANDEVTRYEVYPGTDQWGNPNQGVPKEFVEYNGMIYLHADGTEGKELYSFDMTSKQIQRLTNINPGYGNAGRGWSSFPRELTVFNNEIFFNAGKGGEDLEQELWIYNPSSGQVREIEIDPGMNFFSGALKPAGGAPSFFTPYNGKLYMRAQQVPAGIELFVYDPATDDVTLAWDSAPGTYQQCYGTCLTYGNDGNTDYLTLLNGKLYFSATFDHQELWYYDPVADDGGQLMEIYPGVDQWGNPNHASPHGITAFNDRLFFKANGPSYDYELFSVSWACP